MPTLEVGAGIFWIGFALNPFHMIGVVGVLGATMCYSWHHCLKKPFEDGDGANTFGAFIQKWLLSR